MDKRIIFAVAGSGKTTYIINSLSREKKSLIITYTIGNYENLQKKILEKFDDMWPDNITLLTYFQFLFQFCYKPFLSDRVNAKGITYEKNRNQRIGLKEKAFYLTKTRYFYSNRLALVLERAGIIDDIKNRMETYFDEFVIDEVQDIAGRDFNFLEKIMDANLAMLFLGDFFQHTFDTSRDGNVNCNLFKNKNIYEEHFIKKGFVCDQNTLQKSWRCSPSVCKYITENLGIEIGSNKAIDTILEFINQPAKVNTVIADSNIIKLHYQNSSKYGQGHKNWGEVKGEDIYQDVCVLLNKRTMQKFKEGKLLELPLSTRNKLYVAITRAHRNCYLVEEM